MIKAVIDQLKTGTVTNVISKSDPIKNPQPPYIVVWEDDITPEATGQSTGGIFVAYHNVPGTQFDLDDYMKGELVTLLHKVNLTDKDGNVFRLHDSGAVSQIITTNDDGTISRDRLFTAPQSVAV